MDDPKQDEGIAAKIRFIQAVKRYGEERVGLQILGQDLKKVLTLMKEIHTSGKEPFLYLDHWIKGRQNTASLLE